MIETVQETLKVHADRRYQQFASSSLGTMLSSAGDFAVVSDSHLRYLANKRQDVLDWFDLYSSDQKVKTEMLTFFIRHTMDYLYKRNQFLDIPLVCQAELASLYHRFFVDYRNILRRCVYEETLQSSITEVLVDHHLRLVTFVQKLARANGNLTFVLSEPICHLYSPEIQLDKLHIVLDDLVEPILDLGCGQDGQLVQYLRSKGKIAIGIDRVAESNANIERIGWFDFNFGQGQWGTILSHMAFSNHFRHHHLRENSDYIQYGKTFMTILKSLKQEGIFIYVPGLPFIENILPTSQYRVRQLDTGCTLNNTPLYTSHVTAICNTDGHLI